MVAFAILVAAAAAAGGLVWINTPAKSQRLVGRFRIDGAPTKAARAA